MADDNFRLSGQQLWPTMLFSRKWSEHDRWSPALIEHLYERRASARQNIASGVALQAKSSQGLYESEFDLFESPHPSIQALVAWIDQTIRQVVSIANGQERHPDTLVTDIFEAWAHITNDGGFHDSHYHSDCSWCGIFYVQAADCTPTTPTAVGNGVSRFYAPVGCGGLTADYGNHYLSNNRIDIMPQDGMLVLFPAYLLHSGLPYKGERDRILIAFNSRTGWQE